MPLSVLAQLATAADTVLVRQVPPVRSGFEQMVFVASGITSILTLLLVLAVLVVLIGLKAKASDMRGKLDELLSDLRPLTQDAKAAAKDVREAAAAAKEMVLESRETVGMANERVRDSVDALADRVEDVSDLVGRVHHAGERVANVAGSAVGGIKAGARFLGIGRKSRKKRKAASRRGKGPRLRGRD